MGYDNQQSEDTTNTFKTTEKLCSEIRAGDFLLLNGRPCQVIRTKGPSGIGQYRYLGTDLFTKELREESSFTSTSGSEHVARAVDLMPWRILDIDDGLATAMDEKGDVKQGLAVMQGGNLWSRMQQVLESGRGTLYGLVCNDGGRILIAEMKVEAK